jgi:hypothetical protein
MPGDAFSADEAFDGLVSQFASSLSCYRELVQNSIDAGSDRVEIGMEYLPAERGPGTIAIHVDDFGEGMDETIIHQQLCRLFSSSKEGDLTKIGKFGIGFVSVFALGPEAVLLHTGRGGRAFEVLFRRDRSYTCEPIDEPVEGTRITLFLSGDRARYQTLVRDSQEALRRWCRHSDTEVTFEDRSDPLSTGPRSIREPFRVEGVVPCRVELEGAEIALAFHHAPSYGFYNKGLCLIETADGAEVLGPHAGRFRHIALKVKSRYLEHTLSRESILKDKNYDRVVSLLHKAAGDHLRPALIGELERLAGLPVWSGAERQRYRMLLSFLAEELLEGTAGFEKRPILRDLHRGPASLESARTALLRDGRIYTAAEKTAVTEALSLQGIPVFEDADETAIPPSGETAPAQASSLLGRALANFLAIRERSGVVGQMGRALSRLIGTGLGLRLDLGASVLRPKDWWLKVPAGALQEDPWSLACRQAAYAERIVDPHSVFLAVRADDPAPVALRPFLRDTAAALCAIDAGYRRLTSCTLGLAELEPPLFVVGRSLAPLMARPPRGLARARNVAAVNRDHIHFRFLERVYRTRPRLAVYALAKALLLEDDRLLQRDDRLMRFCHGLPLESWPGGDGE